MSDSTSDIHSFILQPNHRNPREDVLQSAAPRPNNASFSDWMQDCIDSSAWYYAEPVSVQN